MCCLCLLTCIGTVAEKVEVIRSYGCNSMKHLMQSLVDAKQKEGHAFKTMALTESSLWCFAVVMFEDKQNKTDTCVKLV